MSNAGSESHPPFVIPDSYQQGYAKARLKDRTLAENYVRHTTVGDPELDPVMEDCMSVLEPWELNLYVAAGIEQNEEIISEAPKSLREFFHKLDNTHPSWLNHESFKPSNQAIYKNAGLVLGAFVAGVLVEGFSTMIAKSFYITGRVGSDNTKRRLGFNARHLLEIFYPDGMLRTNDGYKITVRIRFVHSKIRYLLNRSDEWDSQSWGYPLSAAHIGFAISVFSMRLLHFARRLGVRFSKAEKQSIMDVWRYVGYLFGVPEAILYETIEDARKYFKIGLLCEPPPDQISADVANALIHAIPSVTSTKDEKEAKSQLELAYSLSRILLGRKLSEQFQYPRYNGFLALILFRGSIMLERLLKDTQFIRRKNFSELLGVSAFDTIGISYRLPTHVKDALSQDW